MREVLNILIFVLAFISIWFNYINHDLYYFFKPLTTITILMIPVSSLSDTSTRSKYFFYILVGLVFCLIGDVFLLNDAYFIWGLISFLLAHILFSIGFMSRGGFKAYWLPILLLAFVGIPYVVYISQDLADLKLPVLLYFAFIIFMAWQGINLYLWKRSKAFLYVAIAVILFVISDSILAYDKFIEPFQLSRILILGTYWTAITLLANSTLVLNRN